MTSTNPMTSINMKTLQAQLLVRAAAAPSGRASQTFHAAPGGLLNQVLLALISGHALSEHDNPGEAFLHVLSGKMRLSVGEDSWVLDTDEHLAIPQQRHTIEALHDCTALLTFARTSRH